MVIQNKHTHYSPNHKPDHHKSAKPLGIMGGSSLNKAWYALEYIESNNKVSYHYQPTLVYTPSTHAISDTVCASNFIPPGNYCNQLTSVSNSLLVGLPMEHHFKQTILLFFPPVFYYLHFCCALDKPTFYLPWLEKLLFPLANFTMTDIMLISTTTISNSPKTALTT